MFTKLCK